MTDNIIDRDCLQDQYIRRLIQELGQDNLIRLVYQQLDTSLDKYTVDELIQEVSEEFPDLLD